MDRALPGKVPIPDSTQVSMFSGIEHKALSLHIGYKIESFLIHIETLTNARDDICIPIGISGSSSIHVFLVQNEQLEPVLVRMKSS